MKKRILYSCLIGSIAGIALGFMIPLFISIKVNDGNYYPCTPDFVNAIGNTLNATILQTLLCACLGILGAISGLIYRIEKWNLLKQSIISGIILSTSMITTAYICYWVPHTSIAILGYMLQFFGIYAIIWLILYLRIRKNIQELNETLQSK